MKRTLSFMVMALALLLTQCRKPEVKFPSPVAPEGMTVSMTVTAGPGSKTNIDADGRITWSSGDKLYVGDGSKCIGCLTLTSGADNPTGIFSGEVTLPTGTENGEKTFHFFYLGSGNGVTPTYGAESVDVSFATQEIYANGTNLSDDAKKFHVGYGSANGTVTDGVVTGINVTMVSKVALARFSFKKNSADYTGALTLSGDNIYNSMTVGFGGSFNHGETPGSISLTGSHSERYVMLVPTGDATAQTLTFTGSAEESGTGAVSGLESNKFYGKTGAIAVSLAVPSYLPGEFTINSGGTKVKFSKGNLYYDGTTDNKWKFEANQYDFRTYGGQSSCINGYSSTNSTPTNDWGLFGWSGSDTEHYGKTTSLSKSDYSGETLKDWGDITDLPPAGEGKTWHTLSDAEWEYLMDKRSASTINGTSNARYAAVKVNGVCGIMLFPDTFTWPSGLLTSKPTTFNTHSTTWNGVNYTYDFVKLESAGVVFLPAAGSRYRTTVSDVGSIGKYWSSTPYGSDKAYRESFKNNFCGQGMDYRYYGFSVRLVRSAS